MSNMNHASIVDQIGALALEIKALQAARKALCAELENFPAGKLSGFRYVATLVDKVDWRLDTKAVKIEMGEPWYDKRCKQVTSRSVRTTSL